MLTLISTPQAGEMHLPSLGLRQPQHSVRYSGGLTPSFSLVPEAIARAAPHRMFIRTCCPHNAKIGCPSRKLAELRRIQVLLGNRCIWAWGPNNGMNSTSHYGYRVRNRMAYPWLTRVSGGTRGHLAKNVIYTGSHGGHRWHVFRGS